MGRWVECWTADSGNRSDVGSNPSDGSCDISLPPFVLSEHDNNTINLIDKLGGY